MNEAIESKIGSKLVNVEESIDHPIATVEEPTSPTNQSMEEDFEESRALIKNVMNQLNSSFRTVFALVNEGSPDGLDSASKYLKVATETAEKLVKLHNDMGRNKNKPSPTENSNGVDGTVAFVSISPDELFRRLSRRNIRTVNE